MKGLAVPSRVLAIGAHPDDIEFGCGATLATWAASGATVHLLVLTDGSKGTWDPEVDVDELVARRRAEQLEAAAVLGAAGVEFLDLLDGELEAGRAERATVCAVIRRLRPDTVLGHDPWKQYRIHRDHRQAGWLAIDGVVAARDPLFFPERGAPHRPERLLLFEPEVVDHVEDARDGFEAKRTALLCHVSQWRTTMGIEAGTPAERRQLEAFAARLQEEAEQLGAPYGFERAEAFKRLEPL